MVLYDNRYEEIKILGSGTYGQVSLVKDLKTGVECAIKILLPLFFDTQQPLTLETFKSEFQTLKNLNHPSVAKVLDTGFDKKKECHYIVFEYIEGKDLFDATKDQSIEVIENLFVEALRALNYLHSQNVYHFDIKPKNFLIVKDQNNQLHLKVIDFGLANFFQQEFVKEICNVEEDGKRPGIGSPPFIAPEIIRGEEADHRADLYSLGCSFYKAFTRKLPFTGNEKEEFYYKHLNEEPKPPRFHNPDIPEYLDEILLNLLKKTPAERYESAERVIKELYLLSAKNVEVEPMETRSSYLPEKGKFIGRLDEWRRFKRIFNDRLFLKTCRINPPYLIISGEKGSGKSRFLEECKNEARKELISILLWEEVYEGDSTDKLQTPCLIIGDDVLIDSSKLDYIELNFESSLVLTILTTSQKKEDIPCDLNHIIELKNFDHIETCPLPRQEEAWQKFESMFEACVYGRDLNPSPFYLVVTGGEKEQQDHFLEECKKKVGWYFIPVMSLEEILNYPDYKRPTPCLVLKNNTVVDSSKIDEITNHFKNEDVLTIFSTSQKKEDIPCNPKCIIELQKSDSKEIKKPQQENEFKETKEFLFKATELEIPEDHVKIIHKVTQGNPLYLTEYLRSQFKQGKYRDSQGKWDQQALDDLLADPTLGATEFIEKQLNKEIDSLNLDEDKLLVLNMMALFDQPTLGDLTEMTNGHLIDEALSWLVDKGILKVDDSQHYIFTNPLYRKIFTERMDPEYRTELCDQIANFLEGQNADQEKILYYRGRGKRDIADVCLMQLVQIERERTLYDKAKENLQILTQKYPLTKKEKHSDIFCTALLELGEICIEMGNFEEAEQHLSTLIKLLELNQINEYRELILIRAYEQMGLSFRRRHQLAKSSEFYQKGLKKLDSSKTLRWMEVVINNRMAQNQFDLGNIEEAERVFTKTWEIWKNNLDDDEKILSIRNDIDFIYSLKGKYDEAATCLEESLKVLSKRPHHENYPITIYKLASIYFRLGRLEESKKLLEKCMQILRERKTPYWLYAVYSELGNIQLKNNSIDEAIVNYKYALDWALKKAPNNAHLIAFNLANCFLYINDVTQAKKYFLFVIKNIPAIKDREEKLYTILNLYKTYLGLSAAYRKEKKLDEALKCLEKAKNLLEKEDYINLSAQYYWQEKADIDKACKNKKQVEEDLKKLDELKLKEGFDKAEYEQWYQTFSLSF